MKRRGVLLVVFLVFALVLRGRGGSGGYLFLEYAPLGTREDGVAYRYHSAELSSWRVVRFEGGDLAEFVKWRLSLGASILVPDVPVRLYDFVFPTPEELEPMWGLRNVGQRVEPVPGCQLGDSLVGWDIGGYGLINSGLGCGGVVLVVDTGIDGRHRELRHALWGVHWTPRGEVSEPEDDEWIPHGTHVAGTIVAAVNGVAPVGVAPCAKVVSVDIFDGEWTTMSRILMGLDWALEKTKRGELGRVLALNASWGGVAPREYQKPLRDAFWALARLGVVLVVAAGNDGRVVNEMDFPASWSDIPELVTVGAYGPDGKLACFSNRGSLVHVGAPGVGIFSTVAGGGAAWWDGTSMATPHVVGVVAVLRQLRPEIEASMVRGVLVETSKLRLVDGVWERVGCELRGGEILGGMVDLPGALGWDGRCSGVDPGPGPERGGPAEIFSRGELAMSRR